ncbi:MAG: hypothetical protein RL748_1857 [Pseudomonadota bacterium]
MRRIPIYLPENLYQNLKIRASSKGVSISELILHLLEKNIQQDRVTDAHAYFERLKPLASFAEVDSSDYVRTIRGKNRIMRTGEDA